MNTVFLKILVGMYSYSTRNRVYPASYLASHATLTPDILINRVGRVAWNRPRGKIQTGGGITQPCPQIWESSLRKSCIEGSQIYFSVIIFLLRLSSLGAGFRQWYNVTAKQSPTTPISRHLKDVRFVTDCALVPSCYFDAFETQFTYP